jgi:Flp pilus assembly protein TadD
MRAQRVFISIVGVLTLSVLMWHGKANADIGGRYNPPVLSKAERALERGNPDRAVELMQGSISESPRRAIRSDVNSILCRAHYQQGVFDLAEQACTQALALGGDGAAWSNLNNRGVMRMLQGRYEEAIADLRSARRSNPTAKAVRRNLLLAEKAQESHAL